MGELIRNGEIEDKRRSGATRIRLREGGLRDPGMVKGQDSRPGSGVARGGLYGGVFRKNEEMTIKNNSQCVWCDKCVVRAREVLANSNKQKKITDILEKNVGLTQHGYTSQVSLVYLSKVLSS
jgi:hypothetical protein